TWENTILSAPYRRNADLDLRSAYILQSDANMKKLGRSIYETTGHSRNTTDGLLVADL
ncbi:hypothetical protein HAX54_019957, partial [Datura stramonium]|nr:hypothetical protein [Datura stramonium]